MANYKKYKKKSVDAKKIAVGVGAVLLAGLLTAGVCCTGYASRNADGKWFKNSDLSTWHWSDKVGDMGDTGELPPEEDKQPASVDLVFNDEDTESPLKVTFNRIAPLVADEPMAIANTQKSYLITAKCTPEDTTDTIDMSLSWSNDVVWQNQDYHQRERSEDVNTYVKLDHEDGAKTATVTFLKNFQVTINLNIKVHERSISKTVKLDCFSFDTGFEQEVGGREQGSYFVLGNSEDCFVAIDNARFIDEYCGSIYPSKITGDITLYLPDDYIQSLPQRYRAYFSSYVIPITFWHQYRTDIYGEYSGESFGCDGFLEHVYSGDDIRGLKAAIYQLGHLYIEGDVHATMYVKSGGQEVIAETMSEGISLSCDDVSYYAIPASDVNPGDDLVFY